MSDEDEGQWPEGWSSGRSKAEGDPTPTTGGDDAGAASRLAAVREAESLASLREQGLPAALQRRDSLAASAYVLGCLSGIVVYLLGIDDDYVRFHGAQSIAAFGALAFLGIVVDTVIGMIGTLNQQVTGFEEAARLAPTVLWGGFVLAALGLWAYLIVATYRGRDPRVLIVDDVANLLA